MMAASMILPYATASTSAVESDTAAASRHHGIHGGRDMRRDPVIRTEEMCRWFPRGIIPELTVIVT